MRLPPRSPARAAPGPARARELHLHLPREGRDDRLHQRAAVGREGAAASAARPSVRPRVRARRRRARSCAPSLDLDVDRPRLRASYNIPLALVRAVMHAESNFDPRALSRKGASGVMQLMPGTASEMYVKDIFDARQNIDGGVRYLRVLANEFDGDMVKMVAAYNAGPDAVRKYGGQVPPFEETQAYVQQGAGAVLPVQEQEGAMSLAGGACVDGGERRRRASDDGVPRGALPRGRAARSGAGDRGAGAPRARLPAAPGRTRRPRTCSGSRTSSSGTVRPRRRGLRGAGPREPAPTRRCGSTSASCT